MKSLLTVFTNYAMIVLRTWQQPLCEGCYDILLYMHTFSCVANNQRFTVIFFTWQSLTQNIQTCREGNYTHTTHVHLHVYNMHIQKTKLHNIWWIHHKLQRGGQLQLLPFLLPFLIFTSEGVLHLLFDTELFSLSFRLSSFVPLFGCTSYKQ